MSTFLLYYFPYYEQEQIPDQNWRGKSHPIFFYVRSRGIQNSVKDQFLVLFYKPNGITEFWMIGYGKMQISYHEIPIIQEMIGSGSILKKKSVIGFGSSFFTNDLIYLDESSITLLFKTSEDFISYLKKFMHKNEMKKRVQSSNFFGRMLVPF